jgi:rubredoxin
MTPERMALLYGPNWDTFTGACECPSCRADLRDLEAGPPFKRTIGVYDDAIDKTTAWRCPDCRFEWART